MNYLELNLPGDGRDNGLVLGSLYRLLNCKFTSFPCGDCSEDELQERGIMKLHHLPFQTFRQLLDELPPTDFSQRNVILPPNLSTLAAFRGLLLHRKYLMTSAAQETDSSSADTASVMSAASDTGNNDKDIAPADEESPDCQMRSAAKEKESAPTNDVSEKNRGSTDPSPPECDQIEEDVASAHGETVDCEMRNAEEEEKRASTPADSVAETNHGRGHQNDQVLLDDFGHFQADWLLLKRMSALMFWPGVMSTVG